MRDNRLTEALADIFMDEKCNVSIYACKSPASNSTSESLSTLKFAAGCTYVDAENESPKIKKNGKQLTGEESEQLEQRYDLTKTCFAETSTTFTYIKVCSLEASKHPIPPTQIP